MQGMDDTSGVVIDASLRFARSNPEVVRYACEKAADVGVPVEDLLRDAIDRVAAARHAAHQLVSPTERPLLRAV